MQASSAPGHERPEFVELFTRDVTRYQDRHRVKSGITGWAQVNGLRGQTSIADRVEWDNYYIRNWSLGFDLRTSSCSRWPRCCGFTWLIRPSSRGCGPVRTPSKTHP